MNAVVWLQLQALRGMCVAIVSLIDSFEAQNTPPPQSPESLANESSEECTHPQEYLSPAKAMGNPNRVLCGKCGKYLREGL